MKIRIAFLWLFCIAFFSGQQGSVFINAVMNYDLSEITINQEIKFKNEHSEPIKHIKFLNWIAAYKNTDTELAKRKIEDRKKDLHFAKKKDLGRLKSLTINEQEITNLQSENIYFELEKLLYSGEEISLKMNYTISLPKATFTGYGKAENSALLKYFFIVPDSFDNEQPRYFRDTEETQFAGTYWNISLSIPNGYNIESNLKNSNNLWQGNLKTDPEFLISQEPFSKMTIDTDRKKTEIVLGYKIDDRERGFLEFYLPLQFRFLQKKLGFIPEKIFISEKFKRKESFFGNIDIRLWKFHFQTLSDSQKVDLDYFSMISKNVVLQNIISQKEQEHWLTNGLKTYLEKRYLHRFYANEKLLGKLPESVKIFGVRPLKYFNISKVPLTARYGLVHQYIVSQNLDQKIGTPYHSLSNFNSMAISHFESGTLLDFISQKIGEDNFDDFIKNYLKNNQKEIKGEDFLNALSVKSGYDSDFLNPYIKRDIRLNFKIKNATKNDSGYSVNLWKNTNFGIPISVTTESKSGEKHYWFDTSEGKHETQIQIPQDSISKVLINNDYAFPEATYRDNYLYTNGLFSNIKNIKLRFIKDIPNPEYNEIYIAPRLNFNAYDKVLLGLNFRNQSLFPQNFSYSVSPYYSSGTGSFTGSLSAVYSIRPTDEFFRSLSFGVAASHFHYDYDLSYRKFSVQSTLNFSKPSRSDTSRLVHLSYNFLEKDLSPEMVTRREYDRYGIWNLGYVYADNRLIQETFFASNFQWTEDFQKLSAEAYYRWEFAKNKKISFRWFGGIFLNNHTRNNFFNFGISRVSNYSFAYRLLGQSATTGVLSQQFILAEGGFKSYVAGTTNQWITSVNIDTHLWKMFNLYGDVGLFKNQSEPMKFVWDCGVKLKIIPDFLEIYFPVQSSLGFEPNLKNYGYRIRYKLIFNLNSIASQLRKGWF